MRVLLPEFLHRVLQRASHVGGSQEFSIEELHQLRSALIVYVPQGQQQRGCSGTEKASLKSEQFVASGDEVHACGAAALRTFFAKHGGSRLVSNVERRVRQERRHRLGFLQDLGRSLVGDSKNERTCGRAGRFLLAPAENRGTGRV